MPLSKRASPYLEVLRKIKHLRSSHSLGELELTILTLLYENYCKKLQVQASQVFEELASQPKSNIQTSIDKLIQGNFLKKYSSTFSEYLPPLAPKSLTFFEECDELVLQSNHSVNAPGVLYTCAPSGIFPATYVSDSSYELFGFQSKEFVSTPNFWIDHIHPIDKKDVLESLPNLFTNDAHIHQYRFKTADGSYVWVEDRLRLSRNAEGMPTEITGFMSPIAKSLFNHSDLEVLDTQKNDFEETFQNLVHEKRNQKLLMEKVNNLENYTIKALMELSKHKDDETSFHIARTQSYVEAIAKYLKSVGQLSDESLEYINDLCKAAPLHDVGKIFITDDILKKSGALDASEWEVMKTHASLGVELLKKIAEESPQPSGFILRAIEIAGSHHENWDGTGYPLGLSNTEIPQSARIMAVADCFDALISKRCYKNAWSYEDAFKEISSQRGYKFDPEVVDALINSSQLIIEIANTFRDPT